MGRTAAATKEPPKFLRVADVAAMLDISESHAYKIMRQLNKELEAKGKQQPGHSPGGKNVTESQGTRARAWKKGGVRLCRSATQNAL